uniref:Uncharacterized protein n=1 Tax=Quercus lobata TaxID=97700 RepID=A0A7N2N2A4_QUELO
MQLIKSFYLDTLRLLFFCICFAVDTVTHIVKNYIDHLLDIKIPLILEVPMSLSGTGKRYSATGGRNRRKRKKQSRN